MSMLTRNYKNPNYMDSDRLKTICWQIRKTKQPIDLDPRFVDLKNAGLSTTLSMVFNEEVKKVNHFRRSLAQNKCKI